MKIEAYTGIMRRGFFAKRTVVLSWILLTFLQVGAQTDAGTVNEGRLRYSLEECISYALEHNITIRAAELDLQSAENTLSQSKQERLPNLSGSAGQSFSNGNSIDPITSVFVSQRIHSTSFGLNSSVTLFNGSKITNQIRQNRLLLQQQGFLLEESRNSIRLQVLEAYVQAAYAMEAVEVARNNLNSARVQVIQAEGLFRAGSLTVKDLSDARYQEANCEYELINAERTSEQQLLTLRQLLEIPPETEFTITGLDPGDFGDMLLPDKLAVYEQALTTLPEMKAGELAIESAAYSRKIAQAGYIPSLSLSGSLGTGYTTTQNLAFGQQMYGNFNQRLGLTLTVPVYDRGKTRLSVRSALISADRAELETVKLEKNLYQKIESAWLNVSVSSAQMQAASESREAAKSALDIASASYAEGNYAPTDLIIAQTAFYNAEQNYLQTKYLAYLYKQLLMFYQNGTI